MNDGRPIRLGIVTALVFAAVVWLMFSLFPAQAASASVNLMDGKPLQCTPIEEVRKLGSDTGSLVRITDRFVIVHLPHGMLVGVRINGWACMPQLVPAKKADI